MNETSAFLKIYLGIVALLTLAGWTICLGLLAMSLVEIGIPDFYWGFDTEMIWAAGIFGGICLILYLIHFIWFLKVCKTK